VLLLEDVVVDVDGRRVLDRVSLVVPRGTHAVVVTDDELGGQLVLQLLAGVRTPTAGRVRVDGLDPATTTGLEGRIGSATVGGEAHALLQLTLDRGVDVWLLDATGCSAPDLGPWLGLLRRPGAARNPTVLIVARDTAIPEGDRLLQLRGGRPVGASCVP
jgi:energy-coupling factor transporter ATP-binding protein EcfA2